MPTRYTSASVRRNLARRVAAMEECERTPHAWAKIQDKPAFQKDKEATKQTLERSTPPDVSPESRTKIARKIAMLENAMLCGKEGVVPPMPTQYQMERVPAGTVGQLIAHDQFWKTHTLNDAGEVVAVDNKGPDAKRGGLFELKDLYRVLRKSEEDSDPDISNLERIRPSGRAAPLADLRLPRTFALSAAAKEKFDDVFAPEPAPPPNTQPMFSDPTAKVQRLPRRKKYVRKPAPDDVRCEAIKAKDGSRCPVRVMPNSKYCFLHKHLNKPEEAPTTT